MKTEMKEKYSDSHVEWQRRVSQFVYYSFIVHLMSQFENVYNVE
jgi:hypothetical protein